MPKKTFTPEQIMPKLRQIEVLIGQGKAVPLACKEVGITAQTFYRLRKEYGGLQLEQAKRLKDLQKENAQLRRALQSVHAGKHHQQQESPESRKQNSTTLPLKHSRRRIWCGGMQSRLLNTIVDASNADSRMLIRIRSKAGVYFTTKRLGVNKLSGPFVRQNGTRLVGYFVRMPTFHPPDNIQPWLGIVHN